MKIEKIKVRDLFDYYCYDIEMKQHSSISIIHAPNGYGKTTVFKMVRNIMSFNILEINDVPFRIFEIFLSNGMSIEVSKDFIVHGDNKSLTNTILIFRIMDNEEKNAEFIFELTPNVIEIIREEGIEEYIQRLEMRRRHIPIEKRIDVTNIRKNYEKILYVLNEIRNKLEINFIDSNRLYSASDRGLVRRRNMRNEQRIIREDRMLYIDERNINFTNENIVRAAKDITDRILSVRQQYSLEAENLDRNFPDRLVDFVASSEKSYTTHQIAQSLTILEEKRIELENAGLVLTGRKSLAPTDTIDDTMRKFYTLYIQDTLKKLSYYDEIKEKLELFIEIINTRTAFSNKVLKIDYRKGVVFEQKETHSTTKRCIPLETLSSGEKHDFIMFYELIFNSGENSVFLIDEPEISLHVAWQMEFVNVLEKICELNGMQAIIATHSPDIVNGHDDLLISLGL